MREAPWKREQHLPWPRIKAVWESHWDLSRPVLLEKSPPNLIRTRDIVAHFQPVKFVIMVRNPYAHAEGLMRRNGWTVSRAANFAMMCLRTQLDNARTLDDALVVTYETLVAEPAAAAGRLSQFLPELGPLDYTANFEVHSVDGTLERPITDLNAKKIAALPASTLTGLNEVFTARRDILAAWGYELISAPA
ncbi:MAG: sulfotransferase [Halioglobus sp.]|nr:sulfotransferase [Halioglobus sp.]